MKSKLLGLVCILAAVGTGQTASTCPALPSDINQRIESYLRQRLISAAPAPVTVKLMESLPNSCYRKLTMALPGASGDVLMYLSPDGRYLTSTLYDLSLDPQAEVSRIAREVNSLLTRDDSPRLPGLASRLTIVEFADLQCPYSKLFADWYSDLPQALRDQSTLVFKHLPLKQHGWARSAALYSACAGKQSQAAFWALASFLLSHQNEITPNNMEAKLLEEVKKLKEINTQELLRCTVSRQAAAIVDRDIEIAQKLAVQNTPTLFISGLRVVTPRSRQELQSLLERELQKSTLIAGAAQKSEVAH